ncbi:MAG: four helix bundle protein [Desulfohalobiaceae bacterium]|nr:four helix bundle protein [Desulfohalobiaceae bacterium]
MVAKSAKDLRVYQKAYALAMEIFVISKAWPKEETYALTDQVRRSARSVCSNLREAWSKRLYEAHFVSKLTDVDAENNETDTWLDFAKDCQYLSIEDHSRLTQMNREIGGMIGTMLKSASSFIISDGKPSTDY